MIPPGPRGRLLLGSLPDYARDTLGFLTRLARQYGDAARFRLGRMPFYLFSHPDQIEQVLRSQSQHFIKDRPLQISTSVFGHGLLTSEGDLWRRQRRLIQPAFLAQRVQGYAAGHGGGHRADAGVLAGRPGAGRPCRPDAADPRYRHPLPLRRRPQREGRGGRDGGRGPQRPFPQPAVLVPAAAPAPRAGEPAVPPGGAAAGPDRLRPHPPGRGGGLEPGDLLSHGCWRPSGRRAAG